MTRVTLLFYAACTGVFFPVLLVFCAAMPPIQGHPAKKNMSFVQAEGTQFSDPDAPSQPRTQEHLERLSVLGRDKKLLRARLLKSLNALQSFQADFTQTTHSVRILKNARRPKGASANPTPHVYRTSGTLYVQRPENHKNDHGKARLLYTPPEPLDLFVRAGRLYLYNRQTRNISALPLSGTPFSLLMRPEISLGRFITEISLQENDRQIFWTLAAAEGTSRHEVYQKPSFAQGSVTLCFNKRTCALEGWEIHDMYDQKTCVVFTHYLPYVQNHEVFLPDFLKKTP